METQMLPRRKITVDEYHWMAQVGILRPDERIELLDGEIICMSPIGSRHMAFVWRLNRIFTRGLGERAIVWVQSAIRLSHMGEPEPDIALLRFRKDGYELHVPAAEDVFAVIEVSDTSLRRDRDVKLQMYAEAGIAEAWIVNLHTDRILVYRDPSPDGYRSITEYGPASTITPLAFPDLPIRYEDIFVPR